MAYRKTAKTENDTMEFLQNHADRAVARHMLMVLSGVVAVALIVIVGSEFLAMGDALGAAIEGSTK